MEKPNLVPSSVIFLFLQQHFLFLFFFKFSTENASSVSRLGRLEKGKQSFSDSGNFVGGDNGGGCSGGAQVGREFFSLVVGWVVFSPRPPEEERQKEKNKEKRPTLFGIFRCCGWWNPLRLLSLLQRKRRSVHLSSFLDTLDECHAVDLNTDGK